MPVEWWRMPDSSIRVYAPAGSEEGRALAAKHGTPIAAYYRGASVAGNHWRLGEGPNGIKRMTFEGAIEI